MACALLRVMDKLESGGGEAPVVFESIDVEEEDRISSVESLDQQRSKETEEKEKERGHPVLPDLSAPKHSEDKPTKDVKEPELEVEEKKETSVHEDKEPVKEAQGGGRTLDTSQ